MDMKKRLESFGGTVVTLTVDAIDYYALAYRSYGEITLYEKDGDRLADVYMDDTMETAKIDYHHILKDGTLTDQITETSTDLYFQNRDKCEHDMAEDIGQYLAATYPF